MTEITREIRENVIREIKLTWPEHLKHEFVRLGVCMTCLDGNFSAEDLGIISVGMRVLKTRLAIIENKR